MKIKEFIEKAIEGGYERTAENWLFELNTFNTDNMFLDPKAWQAVGKVEGWKIVEKGLGKFGKDEWIRNMHRMIDHLIEGGTIESYLKEL